MNFHFEQPDGSVFIGKCVVWYNPFRYYHEVIHHPDIKLYDGEHLVTCKRCKLAGYKSPKTAR